jgi:hypothetical protein
MAKREHPTDTEDDLVKSFSRSVRVCMCGTFSEAGTEIEVCWTWLQQSHPKVFARIVHRGHPNSALFRDYVSGVYRGMRLVRPDVVAPLGTVDSIAGNCRAVRRIVDMFPCLFV